nr:flagellar protein FlgN [Desulfobulbaceae bacterium]
MTQLNDQVVQDVFEALSLNIKLSQDLLTLLGNESEALKAMNPQELLTISKQKRTLLSRIQFLDESLKNHMADSIPVEQSKPKNGGYAGAVVPENFKLSGLIQLLPQDKVEAANSCKAKLNKIRQEIIVKNYINKKFTEDTLGYLGDAIALFTQPVTKNNTYCAKGMSSPKRSSSMPQMISREV